MSMSGLGFFWGGGGVGQVFELVGVATSAAETGGLNQTKLT
jgi:hypothetical protein